MELASEAKKSKLRIKIVGTIWVIMLCIIILRLFIIQVIDSSKFKEIAELQHYKKIEINPQRGTISDKFGNPVAYSLPARSIYAVPEEIKKPAVVANLLKNFRLGEEKELNEKLNQKDRKFVWIKQKVDYSIAKEVEAANIQGIYTIRDYKRSYLLGSAGSHIVGFVGLEGQGLGGMEQIFDEVLKGKKGAILIQKDGYAKKIRYMDTPVKESKPGREVMLTLDSRYMEIVLEELNMSLNETYAVSGSVIVLNSFTGEILAMVNLPSFDPEKIPVEPGIGLCNKSISEVFEPGSTYKIVVASAVLEENLVNEDNVFYCENGKYLYNGHVIHDVHPYGMLKVREIISKSSNIGVTKLASLLSNDQMYQYSSNFGFGMKTGIDLPGESGGILPKPDEWCGLTKACMSFGQEVSVTLLQLCLAFAVISNGGDLMEPHIIKGQAKEDGEILKNTVSKPRKIRRVISEQTAQRMANIMCEVVESGTATKAKITNVKIAGKTGTAQRTVPGRKGYIPGKYTSIFVGFPVYEIPIVVGVSIVEPRGMIYGGDVAAPVFKRIVERILQLEKRNDQSINITLNNEILCPDFSGFEINQTITALDKLGFCSTIIGNGTHVSCQIPLPDTPLEFIDSVKVFTEETDSASNVMPSVIGLCLRDAVNILWQKGVIPKKVEGSGVIVQQNPEAGESLYGINTCDFVCALNLPKKNGKIR